MLLRHFAHVRRLRPLSSLPIFPFPSAPEKKPLFSFPSTFHLPFSTITDANKPLDPIHVNPTSSLLKDDAQIASELQDRANLKAEDSSWIVRMAFLGNLSLAIAKTLVWLHSGSSAMLSEAIHSFVDAGNQGLLWIGVRLAQNRADKLHPYGYGRSVYFWALLSAIGTFWLGAGVSLRNSFEDLLDVIRIRSDH